MVNMGKVEASSRPRSSAHSPDSVNGEEELRKVGARSPPPLRGGGIRRNLSPGPLGEMSRNETEGVLRTAIVGRLPALSANPLVSEVDSGVQAYQGLSRETQYSQGFYGGLCVLCFAWLRSLSRTNVRANAWPTWGVCHTGRKQ